MILVVTGSRHWEDIRLEHHVLDQIVAVSGVTKLLHGGSNGADMIAGHWARERNIETEIFWPDWNDPAIAKRSQAGPIRNSKMLAAAREQATTSGFPMTVAAFTDDELRWESSKNSGTRDTVDKALRSGNVVYWTRHAARDRKAWVITLMTTLFEADDEETHYEWQESAVRLFSQKGSSVGH